MKLRKYRNECYSSSFKNNYLLALETEFLELVEAIQSKDLKEAKYESSQIALYILLGLSFIFPKFDPEIPDWMPWEDDYLRMQKWKLILEFLGYEGKIDLDWFIHGNNWERPSKVIYVCSQAGYPLTEEEAQQLIDKVK